jgi:hypothetical protein
METTCSSETSVRFQQTTQSYIPEDGSVRDHRCENLKSYILYYLCFVLYVLILIKNAMLCLELCTALESVQEYHQVYPVYNF